MLLPCAPRTKTERQGTLQLSTLRWIFRQLTLDYAGFQKCCAGFALDLQVFVNACQAKNALLRRHYQLGSIV